MTTRYQWNVCASSYLSKIHRSNFLIVPQNPSVADVNRVSGARSAGICAFNGRADNDHLPNARGNDPWAVEECMLFIYTLYLRLPIDTRIIACSIVIEDDTHVHLPSSDRQ